MTTRNSLIAAGLVLAVALLQSIAFHDLRHDDAYITFRYSWNLARGHGLVFNPGESIMGSTSPGHALVGALLYPLSSHAAFPSVMSTLGCLGWALQAAAIFLLLGQPLGQRGAGFVALCVAAGAAWSHRYVALETNLVAAAVLWASVFAQRRRWIPAALLCAVAGLLRPDAFVLILPLGALCALQQGLGAWRPFALGTALSLPWFVFAWRTFGSPLPQSATAKVGSETVQDYALRAIRYVTSNLVYPTLRTDFSPLASWIVGGAVALAAAVGGIVLARRCRVLGALGMFAVAIMGAYVGMRPQPGIEWHLYPVLLIVAVGALSALFLAGELLGRRLGTGAVRWAGILIVAAFAGRTILYAAVHDRAYWYGARDAAYRDLSKYLVEHADPGDRIASTEVGTIAYYTDLPILDIAGLVTPESGGAAASRNERAEQCRWLVDVPAYDYLYGARRAEPPYVSFQSEPISTVELHAEGETRFITVLVDRTEQRETR